MVAGEIRRSVSREMEVGDRIFWMISVVKTVPAIEL